MREKFTFTLDRERGLVRIKLQGFWSLRDVEAFFETRRKALAELGLPRNQHMTMTDVRGMKIQAQDVILSFQAGLAVPEEKARKLAIVVDAAMARGQANRAINSVDTRYFTDPDAAETWLFAGEPATRSRAA
jgi:hypothetical protein